MGKRIIMTTYGSFGDVHPYIAIAIELKARGHNPVLAVSESYRNKIEAEGIEFYPVRPDSFVNVSQDWSWIEVLKQYHRDTEYAVCYVLMPHLRATYSDLKDAVQDADLLITHHLSFAGSLVAETCKIPWISTVLSPLSFLSAYDFESNSDKSLSPYEIALKQVVIESMLRNQRWNARYWSASARQLRAELGLEPSYDPVFEGQHSPLLVLALFSSLLASSQPDWPPQTQITGFPFYDRHDNKKLSPELEYFLEAGDPPIVFTLGSLFVGTPGNFYLEAAAAVRQLGYRAVLLMGNGAYEMPKSEIPEGVMLVDYAPHSEIFPRAAAIVHHGGVGTTGQALLSGKPMLIVPYAHDQPDNARRLVNLGVARSLTRNEYTCERVVYELKELLFNPSYKIQGLKVRQLIENENGVKTACNVIEKYLESKSNTSIKANFEVTQ